MAKHPGGRPTKITPEVVGKLEQAFLMGCSDLEACLFADISKQCLYDYQKRNPEFADRKEKLKKNPVMIARQRMLDLMNSGDEGIQHKAVTDTLNRYDGKPKDKVEISGDANKPLKWEVEIVRPEDVEGD